MSSLVNFEIAGLTAKLTVSAEADAAPASGEGHQGEITDFIVFSGGRFLATSSDDSTIILWDLQRRTISHQWIAHDGFHRIAVSPVDGRIISMRGTKMKVWGISDEANQSTPIAEHTIEHGGVTSCFWSPNGEWIAFCQITHTSESHEADQPHDPRLFIHVWNAHTMIEHCVYGEEAGFTYNEWGLMGFSPDSRCLAWLMLNDDDPHYSVWNVGTGPDAPPRRVPTQPGSGLGQFESVSFDPRSKRTVTTHSELPNGEMDCSVRAWDNDTGQLLVVMAGHSGRVTRAGFSPDGRRVLSVSMDGTAKIWDAESGVCLLSFEGEGARLRKAVFSPDGCYIATASYDKNVQLWRGDGVRLATFAEHMAWVAHLAFSPDGRTLASGDDAGIVHIRDIGASIRS